MGWRAKQWTLWNFGRVKKWSPTPTPCQKKSQLRGLLGAQFRDFVSWTTAFWGWPPPWSCGFISSEVWAKEGHGCLVMNMENVLLHMLSTVPGTWEWAIVWYSDSAFPNHHGSLPGLQCGLIVLPWILGKPKCCGLGKSVKRYLYHSSLGGISGMAKALKWSQFSKYRGFFSSLASFSLTSLLSFPAEQQNFWMDVM